MQRKINKNVDKKRKIQTPTHLEQGTALGRLPPRTPRLAPRPGRPRLLFFPLPLSLPLRPRRARAIVRAPPQGPFRHLEREDLVGGEDDLVGGEDGGLFCATGSVVDVVVDALFGVDFAGDFADPLLEDCGRRIGGLEDWRIGEEGFFSSGFLKGV